MIDCTKIPIIAPTKWSDQYIDYKGSFSLNVQMVVNHRGAITHLSSHWPGSVHDLHILKESDLHLVLQSNLLGNKFLLGNSGYQCWTNLLTPYAVEDTDEKE